MQEAHHVSERRIIGQNVALPTGWSRVRAVDNDQVNGVWWECDHKPRGLYVRRDPDEWVVGLYHSETDMTINIDRFTTASDATAFASKVAFEEYHY